MSISSTFVRARTPVHPLLVLLSGHGGVALLTLLRNIFAARLIGVEQFGIAAGFAIIVSAVEMATAFGAQQMIVRDRLDNDLRLQSSLHGVQLARGIVGALLIYFTAEPLAQFLAVPDLAWAFRTLSLVPLLTGLVHLDAWRFQRNGRFGPSIYIQLGPAALALLLIWPLYVKYGDFRILLVASITHAVGVLIMSRLVAEQKYLIIFDGTQLRRILRFGLPFALNGLLLLAVFHGEKLLVAHLQGPASLAIVAMGFTLTLTPALILGRSLQAYALPKLAALQKDSEAFPEQSGHVMRLCLYVGTALGLALSLVAPALPKLLGQDFAPLVALFPILAALHGLRVVKTGASIVALAIGDSTNAVLGNLPRVMSLPIIYIMLMNEASLISILWVATASEAVGLLVGMWALHKKLTRHGNLQRNAAD